MKNKTKKIFSKIKSKEFSKLAFIIVAIIIFGVAIYSVIDYYSLCRFAINMGSDTIPDCSLPVASVTSLLLLYLQYCLYQFGLKNSRNKYKIDKDGNPILEDSKIDKIEQVNQIVSEYVNEKYGNYLKVDTETNDDTDVGSLG